MVAPQLFGGVFAWATVVIAASAVSVLALAIWRSREVESDRLRVSEPLAIVGLTTLLVTVLHAVPLPRNLVAVIAPESEVNATMVARGLGDALPSWIPFTRDPGGTHERIVYGVAVLAAFCAARILSVRSRGTMMIGAVALSGLAVAICHLAHGIANADAVFGMFEPRPGQLTGPILNPNNLTGLLSLALPVAIGFALKQRVRAQRFAWLAAATMIAATSLLARSRGGAVALVAGALLFGLLYGLRRVSHADLNTAPPGSNSILRRRGAESATVTATILLASAALAAMASNDFLDSDYGNLSKLEMYREELRLLLMQPEHAWLGVGRGGFGAAFSLLQRGSVRAQHAESLPLQYAIEFGIPFAMLLLVSVAVRLWRPLLRWRSPSQLGALVGVVALALQNLVDFSLELSGIAVPAAVCLGAGLGRSRTNTDQRARWFAGRLMPVSIVSLGLGIGALILFASRARESDIAVARAELQTLFKSRDVERFWELFRTYVVAHPADAEMAGTAAAELVLESDRRAPFWLNRAMSLAPGWEVAHLWAAQWLLARKQWDQALTEIRAAAAIDPVVSARVLCHWLPARGSADKVLLAAPDGANRIRFLGHGANCVGGDPEAAAIVDDVIAGEDPKNVGVAIRRGHRALRAAEWNAALGYARSVRDSAPRKADLYIIEAGALIGLQRAQQAVRLLEGVLDRVDERESILVMLARANTNAGDARGMRAVLETLRAEAAGDGEKLAAALRLLSDQERVLGNDQRALAALREAHRLTGAPDLLASAARLATQLGQLEYALSAWRELCVRDPANPGQYCRSEEEVQRALGSRR